MTYKELDVKLGKLTEKKLSSLTLALRAPESSIEIWRNVLGRSRIVARFELGGKLVILAIYRPTVSFLNKIVPQQFELIYETSDVFWKRRGDISVWVPARVGDYFDVDAGYLYAQYEKHQLNYDSTKEVQ